MPVNHCSPGRRNGIRSLRRQSVLAHVLRRKHRPDKNTSKVSASFCGGGAAPARWGRDGDGDERNRRSTSSPAVVTRRRQTDRLRWFRHPAGLVVVYPTGRWLIACAALPALGPCQLVISVYLNRKKKICANDVALHGMATRVTKYVHRQRFQSAWCIGCPTQLSVTQCSNERDGNRSRLIEPEPSYAAVDLLPKFVVKLLQSCNVNSSWKNVYFLKPF